nr:type II toxin-antitoxin system VapC family toxin [Flexivirga aerilata]
MDTSALVPLMIAEPTSDACGEFWDLADRVVCTRLAYVEAVAALAMAERMDRVSSRQASRGRAVLDELWLDIDVVELGPELMAAAARQATVHGLRGYDATHCAAAVNVNDPELVAVSGDKRLLSAWLTEGVAVGDVSA